MKKVIAIGLMTSLLSFNAYADAHNSFKLREENESTDKVQKRIERVERSMSMLQKYVYNLGSMQGADISSPDSAIKADELTLEVKNLRGRLENLEFEIARLKKNVSKISTDIEYRISELEKRVTQEIQEGKLVQNIEKQLDEDKPNKLTSKLSDEYALYDKYAKTHSLSSDKQYEKAYSMLAKKEYKDARESFVIFITDNPNHVLVGNAYYWLGETYFHERMHDKAAVEYLKGYQSDSKGSKAPDNLLKLGLSLMKLGRNKEACSSFVKIQNEFPALSNSVKRQNEAAMKKAMCN